MDANLNEYHLQDEPLFSMGMNHLRFDVYRLSLDPEILRLRRDHCSEMLM